MDKKEQHTVFSYDLSDGFHGRSKTFVDDDNDLARCAVRSCDATRELHRTY